MDDLLGWLMSKILIVEISVPTSFLVQSGNINLGRID